LTDLMRNDASVQNLNFGGAYDYIAIRGWETSTTESYRRDGLQTLTLSDIPFENKERVEVLKGVSGFLFGFSPPGGTINYVVKRPTRERFTTLDAELRSFDGRYLHLDAGGPVPGTSLGWRVNAAVETQGDFDKLRDLRRHMVSAALDVKPAPGWLLQLDVEHQDKEAAASSLIPPASNGRLLEGFDPRVLVGAPWLRYGSRGTTGGLRLSGTLGENWSLVSQWNLTRLERDAGFPYVSSLEPDGTITIVPSLGPAEVQNQRGWSQQTMLLGDVQLGGLKHEVVVGAYTARSNAVFCGYLPDQPAFTTNLYAPSYPADAGWAPLEEGAGCPQRAQQWHLFASDTVHLSDRWQAIFGLRHVDYANRFSNRPFSYEGQATSPTAALLFKPTPGVTIYGSYARSLQEGSTAPNEPDVVNAGEVLSPIEARQLELGAKARWGKLGASFAVFRMSRPADYVDASTGVFGRYGEQVNEGVEVSASGDIGRQWRVVGSLSHLKARLTRNADPALDGRDVAAIPRTQAALHVEYRPSSLPGITLQGGVFHVGDRWFDAANQIRVDGYSRLDLAARYATTWGSLPLLLRLNVDNATDLRHWESVAYGGVTPGAPRTVRLSAQLAF
jgi:iron complex outermembrane recepter protein